MANIKTLFIKRKSADIRRRIFKEGMIISMVIILIIQPFRACRE